MKKLTKALMAGVTLLAVTSFVGCSFVKDLSNSKYEAANTVEDVYPDLEKKVTTPVTDEASLKKAITQSVSDVMKNTAGLSFKKASTGTEAVKEVKDFVTAFSDAVTKFANGDSKTIDFDKTVDIEDIKFEDLLELGVSVYNEALELEGEDVSKGKPNPEVYETALKKLNISSNEALVFEDSEIGMKAAENANINYVKIKM